MTTLAAFEDVWITLMLVAALRAQAQVSLLSRHQVVLLHQLRARLHESGPEVAAALEATADLDELLATLEKTP